MDELQRGIVRVIVLEPHQLIRHGLKLTIEQCQDLLVVGETGCAQDAVALVSNRKPNIILLSTSKNNGESFLDLIPEMSEACPDSAIILLEDCDESPWLLEAVQNGVKGIVLKSQPPEVLQKAIQKVNDGEAWFERAKIANLLNLISHTRKNNSIEPQIARISKLSKRERQVVTLVAQMMKNQQIAATLHISDVTVRHHLTSIYSKLEVSGRLELLVFAHRYGLVDLSDDGELAARQGSIGTFMPF